MVVRLKMILTAIIAGLGLVVLIYVSWLVVRVFLFDQFITPTESMEPTLLPGDRVIVNKAIAGARIYTDFNFRPEGVELKSRRTRGIREVRCNDIVVFNFPHHDGRINFVINNVYAKRCVGVPGDTVVIVDGHFHNNNYDGVIGVLSEQDRFSQMPDSLIPDYAMRSMPFDEHMPWTIKNFGPLYLPRKGDIIDITPREACLYRMLLEWETGKRITFDWDAGTVMADGSPMTRHEFLNDYYFMCGDNVSNSNDSRYWGPVPGDYIVGVVTRVSYSLNPRTGKYRHERMLKNVNRQDI